MEATGIYHEPLAYALHEMGVQVSVVNPVFVRDFAKGMGVRSKTDKKDSMVLARYGVATQPRLWQPEPVEVRELKACWRGSQRLNMIYSGRPTAWRKPKSAGPQIG